jgi:hypothetical protein
VSHPGRASIDESPSQMPTGEWDTFRREGCVTYGTVSDIEQNVHQRVQQVQLDT